MEGVVILTGGSNNGLRPAASSAALVESLRGSEAECAAGDAGR